jgi:hypothetical protein
MDITPEELQEFDRKIRSYITAMLLQDDEEMGQIAKDIMEYSEHPAYSLMMLSSYGAMVCYLLALMTEEETLPAVFATWSEISQEIEIEAILGPEV